MRLLCAASRFLEQWEFRHGWLEDPVDQWPTGLGCCSRVERLVDANPGLGNGYDLFRRLNCFQAFLDPVEQIIPVHGWSRIGLVGLNVIVP